jgi:dephospho-CoA kinase
VERMLKIGITGGIGSGKSVVAGIFNVLGIPVFDADKEARNIMQNDELLVSSIKKAFGDESYLHGKLNRPYIANIVFNQPEKLQILNNLVHPAAINAATAWMNAQTTPYVIKEAALMFESGSTANLDYVVGVHTPTALRVKRVMDRDHITRNQVLARMKHQMKEVIKMKLCNFVVINDEQHLLIPQVLQLHQRFLQLAEQKK